MNINESICVPRHGIWWKDEHIHESLLFCAQHERSTCEGPLWALAVAPVERPLGRTRGAQGLQVPSQKVFGVGSEGPDTF